MKEKRIVIFDTTLRDGEQTPGVNLNLTEKLEIARNLQKLGVDVIEAGFPATSKGDFAAVEAVAKEVDCTVAALCRCVKSDIDAGYEALKHAKKPRLHLFIATSDIHMEYKLKMTPEKVVENAVKSVTYARTLCEDIEFSCEDASRSRPDFVYEIVEKVIDAGATTINLPDTVGYAIPDEYGKFIKGVIENVPNMDKAIISVHCHNDLGMATANTLSALQNGAGQAEVTVNGIGERAGNCGLEELVMIMKTRHEQVPFTNNVITENIYRTSQLVSNLTAVSISEYKAIVGKNAFAHESGIHQHGVLENPMTYEIMTPESVGKKESTLVLGKLSGRHAFVDKLEKLGYTLNQEEIDEAFVNFKAMADRKKNITDNDLEAIISHKIADVKPVYQVESFQIATGKNNSMSSITLKHNEEVKTEAAIGGGPIYASYNAINKILGKEIVLDDYSLNAVTSGGDALGDVSVRIKYEGRSYTGKGLATDIIESSINAYVQAVNRMMAE